ncbi:MFS transporter [Escherichia coli]
MIALVCFITVINYLDRTALGIAAPTIMETTGITKEQYSWIVSAFQLAYTLGQPVMGFFIDTVGLKLSCDMCRNFGHWRQWAMHSPERGLVWRLCAP